MHVQYCDVLLHACAYEGIIRRGIDAVRIYILGLGFRVYGRRREGPGQFAPGIRIRCQKAPVYTKIFLQCFGRQRPLGRGRLRRHIKFPIHIHLIHGSTCSLAGGGGEGGGGEGGRGEGGRGGGGRGEGGGGRGETGATCRGGL